MPHIKIFNKNDIKAFDSPPVFNGEERKRFFYLPKWAGEFVESFRSSTNRIGFMLQVGYFKAVNKFFTSQNFHQSDIEFVAHRLNIPSKTIDLSTYTRTTFERHQELILENMGIQKFDQTTKKLLISEARNLCSKQIKPRLMLMSMMNFLREKKIEIPGYHTFSEVIANSLRNN